MIKYFSVIYCKKNYWANFRRRQNEKENKVLNLIKTELYLGKGVPGGFEVTEQQFAEFIKKIITKYFPQGITIYEAYGQMQESDKSITKQATWVVEIVRTNTAENDKKIKLIIDDYRKEFQRPQVMWADSAVKARFYTHE